MAKGTSAKEAGSEQTAGRPTRSEQPALTGITEALKKLVKAVEEANAVILKDPIAPQIVAITTKYTGAPEDAIRQGNHRLKFTTTLQEKGLNTLGEELAPGPGQFID